MVTRKGQALVETSLILPIFMLVILGVLDPFFFALDAAVAKSWSFLAAREASIHEAGGGVTCAMRVSNAPMDTMIRAENVVMTVTPCPNDPTWVTPTGSQVTARITFDYPTLFWAGATWHGAAETRNIFQ